MEGQAYDLFWFSNNKVKVEVPFFQRRYVWGKDEWEELIQSINSANIGCMPFIGSFILQKTQDDNKYLVIDGQQRITTLSIFIKAYIDTFKQLDMDAIPEFRSIIYEKKKTSVSAKAIYRSRLIPSYVDQIEFEQVMNVDEVPVASETDGNIKRCYHYFANYISKNSDEDNYILGDKLSTNNNFFISILLDKNDDEQKIFDSVNTLGKDLTNAEIIKNYLFQRMRSLVSDDAQMMENILTIHQHNWVDIFYSDERKSFWEHEKVLGRIKTNNLEAFLKDYATIKKIYAPSTTGGIGGLDKSYKQYINNINSFDELTKFSKDLADYANCFYEYNENYNELEHQKISDVLNTTLLILDKTETSTFNPYIMKLVKEKPDNMNEQLYALQKFIIQRLIYKAVTKNYNKVCENLLDHENPVQYLIQYNENDAMNMNEFPMGLKRINNKPATLILFLIEMIRRNGNEDKYSDMLVYNNSLEHIMPQKWERHWMDVECYKKELDEYVLVTDISDVAEIRKNKIYSIGNMTLLKGSLNSAISNESFSKKIDGVNDKPGIKKYVGSISVAQEIVDSYYKEAVWNEQKIDERSQLLFNDLNSYYHFI